MFHKLQYTNKTVVKTVLKHILVHENSVFAKKIYLTKFPIFWLFANLEKGLNSTLYLDF